MTESDIGSDKHRRPSSAEIDMAVYKDRVKRMDADQNRLEDKMDSALRVLSQIETNLALGNQRFDKIEEAHRALKGDTTARLDAIEANAIKRIEALESDKRGPVAIVLSVLSALGSGATAWFK